MGTIQLVGHAAGQDRPARRRGTVRHFGATLCGYSVEAVQADNVPDSRLGHGGHALGIAVITCGTGRAPHGTGPACLALAHLRLMQTLPSFPLSHDIIKL